jgi:hypothetical protein
MQQCARWVVGDTCLEGPTAYVSSRGPGGLVVMLTSGSAGYSTGGFLQSDQELLLSFREYLCVFKAVCSCWAVPVVYPSMCIIMARFTCSKLSWCG